MVAHAREIEFGFQIAPMLDVLFVLLLFFMVTAGVQRREATLTTPVPTPAPPGPQVEVVIQISGDGAVIFNGLPVDVDGKSSLPQTILRLRAVLADSPRRPVVIEPEPSARHQRVVDVLDACKAAGVQNVAFGASS